MQMAAVGAPCLLMSDASPDCVAGSSGDPLAAYQFTAATSASAAATPSAQAAAAPGTAASAGSGTPQSGEAYLEQSKPPGDTQAEQQQLRALLKAHFPQHGRRAATVEYCQLPPAVKAAIAARLTSDMLQVTPGLLGMMCALVRVWPSSHLILDFR